MPKIPPVKVSEFVRFLEIYLGLVLIKTKNGHQRYQHPSDTLIPRVEFSSHGKTKKELPGVYVLNMLKPFDINWEEFCDIVEKL